LIATARWQGASLQPNSSCCTGKAEATHYRQQRAAIVGKAQNCEPDCLTMRTIFGGRRIVDMLTGENLPQVC